MKITKRVLCGAGKKAAPYFNPRPVISVSQVDERPSWTDDPKVRAKASHNPKRNGRWDRRRADVGKCRLECIESRGCNPSKRLCIPVRSATHANPSTERPQFRELRASQSYRCTGQASGFIRSCNERIDGHTHADSGLDLYIVVSHELCTTYTRVNHPLHSHTRSLNTAQCGVLNGGRSTTSADDVNATQRLICNS